MTALCSRLVVCALEYFVGFLAGALAHAAFMQVAICLAITSSPLAISLSLLVFGALLPGYSHADWRENIILDMCFPFYLSFSADQERPVNLFVLAAYAITAAIMFLASKLMQAKRDFDNRNKIFALEMNVSAAFIYAAMVFLPAAALAFDMDFVTLAGALALFAVLLWADRSFRKQAASRKEKSLSSFFLAALAIFASVILFYAATFRYEKRIPETDSIKTATIEYSVPGKPYAISGSASVYGIPENIELIRELCQDVLDAKDSFEFPDSRAYFMTVTMQLKWGVRFERCWALPNEFLKDNAALLKLAETGEYIAQHGMGFKR
jgi:hypothetical protein